VDKLLADPSSAALIKQLNPTFEAPARPFKRLAYVDAIAWLNEHDIKRPAEDAEGKPILGADGKPEMVPHAVGDDIAEAAERQMTDILGVPIFLHGFPAELKAFYMKKSSQDAEGRVYTESCDLLMPGVGEIVGMCFPFMIGTCVLTAYIRWFDEDSRFRGTRCCVQAGRH
jgi:asparaginyl-tRNA synthetase